MNKFRAETIDDVIEIMDEIVRNSKLRGSRLGYFTVLYRTVTRLVKERCDVGGFFEDDERMRHLDVVFANRYFDAFFPHLHQEERPISDCWKVSFVAADEPSLILMQHLLLGMNAHISLDLGVATAEIAQGQLDESLRRDFYRLNNLLAGLVSVVQEEISQVSPLMGLLDWALWRFDEYIVDIGMRFARDRALDFAQVLTTAPQDSRLQTVTAQDVLVAGISRRIMTPWWYARPALWMISRYEKSQPHEIISGLAGERWYEAVSSRVTQVIAEAERQGLDLAKRETQLMPVVKL